MSSRGSAGIALASDAEVLVTANRTQKRLDLFEVATGNCRGQIPLEIEPIGLQALSPSLFLVQQGSPPPSPLLLLRTKPEPAVFWVPPEPAEASGPIGHLD